jgi:hypothetical protein
MRDENYIIHEDPLTDEQKARLRAGDFSEFVDDYASPNFALAIGLGLGLWGCLALIGWALHRALT